MTEAATTKAEEVKSSATEAVRRVPLGDLVIDAPTKQRRLRMARVRRIARNFDPLALQQATVSERPDGTLILLDGQHRKAAMELRITQGLLTPSELECKVISGLTEQEESRLFVTLNDTNRPTSLDRWFPRIAAGDEELLIDVSKALSRWGWTVDGQPGKGHILAVASLEQIARDGQALEKKIELTSTLVDMVLQVITEAWGLEPDGVRAEILRGVAALIEENVSVIRLDRLTDKLRRYHGGPVGLLASAQANGKIRRVSPAMSVADLLTIAYNQQLQSRTLKDWTRRK